MENSGSPGAGVTGGTGGLMHIHLDTGDRRGRWERSCCRTISDTLPYQTWAGAHVCVCVSVGVICYLFPLVTARWVSDMKKQTCSNTRRLCKRTEIADGWFCIPSCVCDLEEAVYIYTGKRAGAKISIPVCSKNRLNSDPWLRFHTRFGQKQILVSKYILILLHCNRPFCN